MKLRVGILAAFSALALGAGTAHALPVSEASVGGGQGCTDSACANPTLSWSQASGTGSGTLSLSSSVPLGPIDMLIFSITLPSTTFLPTLPSTNDNGVTRLDFTNVTYSGTAAVAASQYVPGQFDITGGTGAIAGTQTPTGAGSAGGFSASSSLLSGYCLDIAGFGVTCGIIFSADNDFNFPVNGATRYFTHTVNVTAVPEPASTALAAIGLAALGLAARRSRR